MPVKDQTNEEQGLLFSSTTWNMHAQPVKRDRGGINPGAWRRSTLGGENQVFQRGRSTLFASGSRAPGPNFRPIPPLHLVGVHIPPTHPPAEEPLASSKARYEALRQSPLANPGPHTAVIGAPPGASFGRQSR